MSLVDEMFECVTLFAGFEVLSDGVWAIFGGEDNGVDGSGDGVGILLPFIGGPVCYFALVIDDGDGFSGVNKHSWDDFHSVIIFLVVLWSRHDSVFSGELLISEWEYHQHNY